MVDIINYCSELLTQTDPNTLSRSRGKALEQVRELGIPVFGSEHYQRTDLSKLLSGEWKGLADATEVSVQEGKPIYQGDFAGYEGNVYTPSSTKVDSLALLAEALSPSTRLIKVGAEGGAVHLRLQTHINGQGSCIAARRQIIEIEERAELWLSHEEHIDTDLVSLVLASTEIYLHKGARLHYVDVEHNGSQTNRVSTLHIHQEAESGACIHFFGLSGGATRNNYHCDLSGQGARLTLGGVALGRGHRHIDNYSYISHSVPYCQSDELFKYLLSGEAYGVFTGRILVAQDAQKTEAYQNSRNLLLSPKARMQAKPQLEIYADDVRCSHGMSTGRLDEDALFYMRQRGIQLSEAKLLLGIAFAEEVIARVEDERWVEDLRDRVSRLLRSYYEA